MTIAIATQELPALNSDILQQDVKTLVQIDYQTFEWFITEHMFAKQKLFPSTQYNKLQIEHVQVQNESIPIYHMRTLQRGVRLQFEGKKNATLQYRVAPSKKAFASVSKLWHLLLEPWERDAFFFLVSLRREQLPAVVCVPTFVLGSLFAWHSKSNKSQIAVTRNDSQWVCVKHAGADDDTFVLNYSVSLIRVLQVCPLMLCIDKMLSPVIVTIVAIFLVFLGCYNIWSMIDEYRFYKKVALHAPHESDDEDDNDGDFEQNNISDSENEQEDQVAN